MCASYVSFSAVVLYLIVGGSQALHLIFSVNLRTAQLLRLLIVIPLILHAYLLHCWIDIGFAQNLSTFNLLSQIAWLIAVLLTITALFKPVENLGILIFPFAALSILLVQFFPSENLIHTLSHLGSFIHIILAVLTMGVLGIAASQAIVLALQNRYLHLRIPSSFIQSLPPLETMENLLFEFIAFGFGLLSIVLATSIIFLPNLFAVPYREHTILASLSWVIFLVLLLGRRRYGWRGKTAVKWTFCGILLLVLSYAGTQLIF